MKKIYILKMDKDNFVRRILDLDSELKLAIHLDEYDKIEKLSIKIGILIQKYLNDRKLYVNK
jgi:hypothetical protein